MIDFMMFFCNRVAAKQTVLAGILASEAQISLRMSVVCFVHLGFDAIFVRLIKRQEMTQVGLHKNAAVSGVYYDIKKKI